ncbi:TIGR02391 family protein [Dyadobacter sp. CY323]|uniref:TIGR02391 family protein n=1 Tax=Dyadobacter sp. CY323 TaxID=2907302 RepID=UPI001F3B2EE6|nr:TIGR02391 family protein [Dyadobacter sp. CY323]MCE6989543.1 TIGR02391 family protein [Dyadobacter sp. CY323]
MADINFCNLATQVGDVLKWTTSFNEIDRLGQAILKVSKENYPNQATTSVRAQAIYDWILSLGRMELDPTERMKRLIDFVLDLTPGEEKHKMMQLLEKNGCPYNLVYKDSLNEFLNRQFHPEVVKHSRKLFIETNYFHAVFEAVKAYNKDVKEKALSDKDGQPLMLSVWGCDSGVLKITNCQTQTEKDFQDGIKFISGGLMSAIRNPTAHEPAITWPISKQDCLDILSLVSFLYRQLDKATYYKV